MQNSIALVVFVQLFAMLEQSVKLKGFQNALKVSVKSILLSRMMREGVSIDDCKLISEYYRKPSGKLNISTALSEEAMKDSVQYTYNLMCEAIGPVETDTVFGAALDRALATNEAQLYSPRNFL